MRATFPESRHFFPIAIVLAALASILFFSPASIDGKFNAFFAEDGPVENLSVVGYFLCILLIVLFGGIKFASRKAVGIIIILLFLALRELNFHTRFTTMGVMKTSFYLSDSVPMVEKLGAAAVLALVAWAVWNVCRAYGRSFLAGLRHLHPTSLAVALSFLCAVMSEGLDGVDRRTSTLGFSLQSDVLVQLTKVEEVLELGIALFALAAVVSWFMSRKAVHAVAAETGSAEKNEITQTDVRKPAGSK